MAVNPLSPGVFTQEALAQRAGIVGVSTSIGAFAGYSFMGPTDEPIPCQSFDIFRAIFGDESPRSETPSAVKAFFDEGGTRVVFVRTLPRSGTPAAAKADGNVPKVGSNTNVVVAATPTGTTITGTPLVPTPIVPGSIIIKLGAGFVEAGRDDGLGGFHSSGTAPKKVLSGTINYTTGAITLTFTAALVALDSIAADFYNFTATELWDVDAKNLGAWGNDLRVTIAINPKASTIFPGTQIPTGAGANPPFPDGVITGPFVVTIAAADRPILPSTIVIKVDGQEAGRDLPPPDVNGNAKLTGSGTSPSQVDSTTSSVNYESGVVTVNFLTPPTAFSLITIDYTKMDRLDVTVFQRDQRTGNFGAVEQFQGLNFFDQTSTQYVKKVIGGDEIVVGADTYPAQVGTSTLIRWKEGPDYPPNPTQTANNTVAAVLARGIVSSVTSALSGGNDGVLNSDGTIKLQRTDITHPSLDDPTGQNLKGIYAFKKVQDVLNLTVPDLVGSTPNNSPLDTAQAISDLVRFAIGSTTPPGKPNRFIVAATPLALNALQTFTWKQGTLMPLLAGISSPSVPAKLAPSFVAIYYPHLKARDITTGNLVTVTPVGHVLGVYARTDATRNVGKAPAGTVDGAIQSAVDISNTLSQTDKDLLYQNNINLIVNDAATGLCVFGARTLFVPVGAGDPELPFQFIQGRRTFMFVEQSASDALLIFVFENNGPQTWSRVTTLLTSFLLDLFNRGFLAGRTAAEAFTVTCDESNNSQADINAGKMNVRIAIATNRPAEFIIITLQQQVLPG